MTADWRFEFQPTDSLPPLAWIANAQHPLITVRHGLSVRTTDRAFFEGTWVGPPGLDCVAEATTVFGSGIVLDGQGPLIVPPAHTLEAVYVVRRDDRVLASNSLVGVLVAAGLELVPGADYVSRFHRVSNGLAESPIELPTTGAPVGMYFYDNLRIVRDGALSISPKPREAPFTGFEEYAVRLSDALRSAIDNAGGHAPVMAVSSGYDSTAIAVIAARLGCRRAVTFALGRPRERNDPAADSGENTARRLGMHVTVFDRRAYLSLPGEPEAEFLATGMSGEDVVLLAMEQQLKRSLLITGLVGGAMWRRGRAKRPDFYRNDLSGGSMTEFRLRIDAVHVPIAVFGMIELPSLQAVARLPEMKPWSIGGIYDQPIPRRIAEEGGIPRGTFAMQKRTATAVMHLDGEDGLSRSSLASVRQFAAAEGEEFRLLPRIGLARWQRLLILYAHRLRVSFVVRDLEARRRRLMHFPPRPGSLLVRWAVSRIRPRYASIAPEDG